MVKRSRVANRTKLVLEFLRKLDDFATASQIRGSVKGVNANQASAALYNLKKAGAVEAVEVDGVLFWFACPPEHDHRVRSPDEVAADIKRPRKWQTRAKVDQLAKK